MVLYWYERSSNTAMSWHAPQQQGDFASLPELRFRAGWLIFSFWEKKSHTFLNCLRRRTNEMGQWEVAGEAEQAASDCLYLLANQRM